MAGIEGQQRDVDVGGFRLFNLPNPIAPDDALRVRSLLAFIEEGPAEGYATNAYRETLYTGAFPTTAIWWTSVAKTHKIVEQTVALNANKSWNTSTWRMYAADGFTVITTIVDTFTYSGPDETSRTRTIT